MLTLTLPRVASLVSLGLLTAACGDTTSTEAMDASAATEQKAFCPVARVGLASAIQGIITSA